MTYNGKKLQESGIKFSFYFAAIAVILGSAAISSCAPVVYKNNAEKAAAIYQYNRDMFQRVVVELVKRNLVYSMPDGKSILNVFDFDHTLVNTLTIVPVQNSAGETEMRDSKCGVFTAADKADFSVFTRKAVYDSEPIEPAFAHLQAYSSEASWNFVLTARSQPHTFSSVYEYTAMHGPELNGVIAVNSRILIESLWEKLRLPYGITAVPSEMKKALLIAALADLAMKKSNRLDLIRYHEDTDSLMSGAMQLLPILFPRIKQEYYDYLRSGTDGHYTYRELPPIRWQEGRLTAQSGEAVEAAAYSSGDCPVK